jgi:branched-chain amino acid transport system ATP-binding protein
VAPEPAALAVDSLCKNFGGLRATADFSLNIPAGECHALIGPNGAGKTTLIAQLSGELLQDSGRILLDGREISAASAARRARLGMTRSFQVTAVLQDFSALENVALAVQVHAGHSFRFWRRARADQLLIGPALGFLETVGLAGRASVKAADLSHGERKPLELAMALATRPRLLLLDEPMAGLGPVESRNMTDQLAALKGRITMLLVEHDMDAVFSLADRISVLVGGHVVATGTPENIRSNATAQAAYLGASC